jgi:hypothetical protein
MDNPYNLNASDSGRYRVGGTKRPTTHTVTDELDKADRREYLRL